MYEVECREIQAVAIIAAHDGPGGLVGRSKLWLRFDSLCSSPSFFPLMDVRMVAVAHPELSRKD